MSIRNTVKGGLHSPYPNLTLALLWYQPGTIDGSGEITRVQVMTDRDTGRSRGFALVEMANEDEAAKAIEALNGKELDGRALNVNEARPKPERSGSKSGGGGYVGGRPPQRESRW